jgi:YbbR domain-containing protein
LAAALRRNPGLRLLSIGLAIGLWLFVNAGERNAQQTFTVPISYRNLPPHFVIVGSRPESVTIEVSGPRTLLSLIAPNRLTLKLDLAHAAVGQMTLKVGPDNFNVLRKTAVVSVSPSQIVLDLDKIITRSVPVRLTTNGAAAEGYHVTATSVNPPEAIIKGPSRQIGRIDVIETDAIDLGDATGDLSREVALLAPAGVTRIEPATVAAVIDVGEIVADKEFRSVPIQVNNSVYRWRLEPTHVDLKLRGPLLLLAHLDLSSAVAVDADGVLPGRYDVPVQVDLPDGVELVHQSAESVKLIVLRPRGGARG